MGKKKNPPFVFQMSQKKKKTSSFLFILANRYKKKMRPNSHFLLAFIGFNLVNPSIQCNDSRAYRESTGIHPRFDSSKLKTNYTLTCSEEWHGTAPWCGYSNLDKTVKNL